MALQCRISIARATSSSVRCNVYTTLKVRTREKKEVDDDAYEWFVARLGDKMKYCRCKIQNNLRK